MRVLQTTTDDDRRQQPLLVWPPTLCVGGPVIMQLVFFRHFYPFSTRHDSSFSTPLHFPPLTYGVPHFLLLHFHATSTDLTLTFRTVEWTVVNQTRICQTRTRSQVLVAGCDARTRRPVPITVWILRRNALSTISTKNSPSTPWLVYHDLAQPLHIKAAQAVFAQRDCSKVLEYIKR